MLNVKNVGALGGLLVAYLGSAGFILPSASAEDIGLVPATGPRQTVRTGTRRVAPRPGVAPVSPPAVARPTVPRPIQDETSAAAGTSINSPVLPTSPQAAAPRAAAPRTAPVPAPVPRAAAPLAPRAAPPARRSREESVNLDALSTPSSPAAPAPPSASSSARTTSPHGGGASGILPNFKFYFDFMLRSWKGSGGSTADFGFDSYHQRLLVEFTPTADLMFQADLLNQRYFESDYQLSPRVQFRWGRIWIPFDDMSPHSMFGGRINTSEFFQGNETAFMPDIWADLGVGFKFIIADSPGFSSEFHAYVVNGFQQKSDGSPVGGEGGTSTDFPTSTHVPYPDFAGTVGSANDNNNDKALGLRWHSVMGRRFGFGLSLYHDVYTNNDVVAKQSIMMIGIDAQLRPTNTTELRVGYVTMNVGLDPTLATKATYQRTGTYIELGQRFGTEDRWKFLVRAGSSQNDNRVVDVSDKTIFGGTLLKNFGMVEAQINYFRDLHQVPVKVAYNYGEFRIVTAF